MLGVLLESRARRQRRAGGAAMSVAAHMAVIGAAVAGTTHSVVARPAPPKVEIVHFDKAVARPPMQRTVVRDASLPHVPSNLIVERIAVPNIVPRSLPPIDMTGALRADTVVLGGNAGITRGGGSSTIIVPDAPDDREWTGNEVLMHVLTSAKPRYPEALRNANVDGRVVARFTVDTLGRVDPSSVAIVQSTHDLFSRAVREALVQFRFKPAQVGSRKVAATAEMPFEFRITR